MSIKHSLAQALRRFLILKKERGEPLWALANIRARLHTRYGARAALTLPYSGSVKSSS